jgi:hypothetical protein
LKTDVVELPEAVLTGATLTAGNETFTGGALINWNENGAEHWAILSVGHGVASDPDVSVNIQLSGGKQVAGTVRFATSNKDSLDASLIEISIDAINQLPTLPSHNPVCRTIDQIVEDANTIHPGGFSLTSGDTETFTVYGFLPAQTDDPIISQAPFCTDLLLVQGNDHDFVPGTSGSVWVGGGGVVDAIQIAGFPDNFSRGIGQPMWNYLAWASEKLNNSVELRAVF